MDPTHSHCSETVAAMMKNDQNCCGMRHFSLDQTGGLTDTTANSNTANIKKGSVIFSFLATQISTANLPHNATVALQQSEWNTVRTVIAHQ